jgi:hypothetical protein
MKLKNLTMGADDRLSKFVKYVNDIDFESYKYAKGKYIQIKDDTGLLFYLSSFKPEMEDEIKKTITDLVTKYWKKFEDGLDFHAYDGDYFIETKQEPKNTHVFKIESMDDDFYCKFDSNFIVNL